MKKRIHNIIKSKFVKNVIVMISGAAGAQFVALILSPIITRLYGPEAFGIMGTFSAIINILIPIAALTYPIAIVLPKKDDEAKGLIKLSLVVSIILSLVLLLLIIFYKQSLINLFKIEEVAPYLYFIPLVIIFTGVLQVTEQWLIRKQLFVINAKVHFFQSVIINGSKAGLGFIQPVASVLVFFQVIANGLRAFMMIVFTKNTSVLSILKVKKKMSLSKLAKKYGDFPLFRAPEVLLSAVSQNLPILLLTSLVGPAAAGFYSIGRTVLALPSRLIGESVGDVFYPRITTAVHNGENVNRLILKATLALIAIGIVPFGLIIGFGPFLFEFVFGNGWSTAGEYAQWIALVSFAIFINRPSIKSLPVLNAQKFLLIITIVILIIQSFSLLIGFYFYQSAVVAVAFFGISGFLLNVLLILITLKIAKNVSDKLIR